MTANNEIKLMAKKKGMCLWEIADKMGIVDSSFSRKLRHELSQKEKQNIFSIIDQIAAEKAAQKENAVQSAGNTKNG
ncbi:MAG: hypothetical protein ACI4HO_03840 [Ruminococcus sp.]